MRSLLNMTIISAIASTLARTGSLDEWFTTAVLGDTKHQGLFPNQSGWEISFNKSFTRDATFSFNALESVDFVGLFQIYQASETGITSTFSSYILDFTSLVTVPNANNSGGLVFVTGVETGVIRSSNQVQKVTDGTFAVVSEIDGERKMTEWREASNL